MYVDTHSHIFYDRYDEDRQEIINNFENEGLDFIVCPGVDGKSSEQSVNLAINNKKIYAAVGYHPSDSDLVNNNTLDELEKLARNEKVVAIGEIGLDYYRNYKPAEIQKKALRNQMELAEQLDLPVVIHNRDSHKDMYEELKAFNGKVRGIMHSFAGDYEFAKKMMDLGYYISISGVVTFKNAPDLREVVKQVPNDYLLSETDSPFLAPSPYRGKRNQPAYVKYVVEKIVEVKNQDIREQLVNNAKTIFNIN